MFRSKVRTYLIHIILLNACILTASYVRKFSMLLMWILLIFAAISLAWLLYNSVDRK